MAGVKHLIECHCYLAIFKNNEKQINHRFPVYSKIDEEGRVIKKTVKCNNCDAMHYVTDICKSELRPGKDDSNVVITKDDLKHMLPENITNFLISNNCDISIWEHAKDVIDENRKDEIIVIKRDIIDERQQVKYIKINENQKIQIGIEIIEDTFII